MSALGKIEKFSATDLSTLRNDLMQSGIDSWQVAEVVSAFLAGRGYGVDSIEVRQAVTGFDILGGTNEGIQAVLETVAYIM